VGYRLRAESRVGARTRVEVITEAILTRQLQADPSLEGVSVVILDEFHERSIHADLALAFLRESIACRDDLFVLVMSATIDTDRIARFLDAPTLSVPGRQWPVEIVYAPNVPERSRPGSGEVPIDLRMARAIQAELSRGEGSILAFLPGIGEIRRVERLLAGVDADILILHSSISLDEQKRVLSPPEGRRRVILSSSIAETSLTVPGVTVVIDSGLARSSRLDARTGMTALVTAPESEFSATQRAGRAGRIGPGRCVRLWGPSDPRVAASPCEMLTADIMGVVLECALWGVADPGRLAWLDPPTPAAWAAAQSLLRLMGALSPEGAITERGRRMSALGLHPRLASVALAGRPDLAARHAATGDTPREAERLLVDLLRRLRQTAPGNAAPGNAAPGNAAPENQTVSAGLALLAGFPDRLARHAGEGLYRFPSGRVASLSREWREAQARPPEWIVAPAVDAGEREGRIYEMEAVDEGEALAWLETRTETNTEVRFAEGRYAPHARLRKVTRRAYGKIVLSEVSVPPGPGDAARAIVAAVMEEGASILPWSPEAEAFYSRARFAQRLSARMPDAARAATATRAATAVASCGEAVGAVGDANGLASLAQAAEEWLLPFIPEDGRLTESLLLDALRYRFDGQAVDRLAPARIALANGLNRALRYEELSAQEGVIPILEVKIQDLFGCPDTPTVSGVNVLLRLLSPARRPIQVTRDLAGFWANTWAEVRKELRGRYPKHQWPENPPLARAEAPKS
jgi:ATP-dependent helicase HrpB